VTGVSMRAAAEVPPDTAALQGEPSTARAPASTPVCRYESERFWRHGE
jgi:hypothetical protein